jgi:hypothetical protein
MQLICDQLGDVEQTAEYNATPEERPDRPPRVRTSINPQAVRRALEAILASGEVPPPSLREVAEPIGQTYANLRHHLSERSRFISARTGATRKPRATNASTPAQEVRQAAVHLHRQGHYRAIPASPTSSATPAPCEAGRTNQPDTRCCMSLAGAPDNEPPLDSC